MSDPTSSGDPPSQSDETGGSSCCNPQITDGVTQTSVNVLGLGPATAAVNAYIGQSQSQTILFSNMVNQQAQYANIAAASLTQELTQLLAAGSGGE
ncbi:RebB family R body protein [Methylobacter sp. Wu8]|uniref:Killing trait domain-containing protein n=1 Tax=Methylobacter tundripaludum TaxID=173365 RepID=A0A2S6H4V3_9GAMM|nr:RebB family R body protein [Methylobacter tundripaludum]MCF7965741.1 RebB family R body protein [Methylobacter tundripaludum]MCK9636471.1 RebB family R body protein [Methylobacter tundripaludum]PPK72450.1 killing trait domain-containing protein [Methylobacter tundripaludum]